MSNATNSSKTNSLIAGPYSWYIDGSSFCFEARYKSNQDFGAPAAYPCTSVHGVNPPR